MNRHDDWDMRLSLYIATAATHIFKWGKHDCVHFAAGAFNAVYDHNPIDILPKYRTRLGAYRIINSINSDGLWAATDLYLKPYDMKRLPQMFAEHGDIVGAYNHEGLEMMGVMEDGGTATFAGPKGLVRKRLGDVEVRWK